jgi:hypothetical protein
LIKPSSPILFIIDLREQVDLQIESLWRLIGKKSVFNKLKGCLAVKLKVSQGE